MVGWIEGRYILWAVFYVLGRVYISLSGGLCERGYIKGLVMIADTTRLRIRRSALAHSPVQGHLHLQYIVSVVDQIHRFYNRHSRPHMYVGISHIVCISHSYHRHISYFSVDHRIFGLVILSKRRG